MYRPRTLLFITLLMIIVPVMSDIESSDIYDWWAGMVPLGPGKTAIAITTGIAFEAVSIMDLWGQCRRHDGELVDRYECFRSVKISIVRWGIELTGLVQITGWWKRDDHRDCEFTEVNIGGTIGQIINIDAGVTSGLFKRDEDAIHFTFNGSSFSYKPTMADDVFEGRADLALLGTMADENLMPISVLEANSNGTWVLNLLGLNTVTKRDGTVYNYYVSGSGSVLLECQYGAGEAVTFAAVNEWVSFSIAAHGQSECMLASHNFYKGKINNNSRMKCATKAYRTDEDMSRWRDWGDIWTSFD